MPKEIRQFIQMSKYAMIYFNHLSDVTILISGQ